ncbi:hypothetical protein [Arthrobacter sp. ES1]|uniref:hypothetical protein n=1 Tax=Arthrobacter sp. ES1 TaxID=1897056 RepID=UPI001CFFB317|nr:hypothetical protein [Arthrobacter sp. ES1]MCB5280577.1 hypothetical protein [Arthrobacter sp. ES1]
MSTDAPSVPRITADIKANLELDPNGWSDLPAFPAHLGTPEVLWGFEGNGTLETDVVLTIDGEDQIVSFWSTDLHGTYNTAEDTLDCEDRKVWHDLEPEDFEAAIAWGKEVHTRISAAVQSLAEAAAPCGSDAYNAIVAFATNTQPPVGEITAPTEETLQFKYRLTIDPGTFSEETDDVESLLETARVWLLHGKDVNIVNLTKKG